MTSGKKKEKISLNDPSWLVPRRTRRNWVASLVTVFVLVTCRPPPALTLCNEIRGNFVPRSLVLPVSLVEPEEIFD